MPPGFNVRIEDLITFFQRLREHIAFQATDLTISSPNGQAKRFEAGTFELVLQVKLSATGTKGTLLGRVNNDGQDFAFVYCDAGSQHIYPTIQVTGPGVPADIYRVVELIGQVLGAKQRRGAPKQCRCCEDRPARLVPIAANRYRCAKGHELILRPKTETGNANSQWTQELEIVLGDEDGCPVGTIFAVNPDGIVGPITFKPVPQA